MNLKKTSSFSQSAIQREQVIAWIIYQRGNDYKNSQIPKITKSTFFSTRTSVMPNTLWVFFEKDLHHSPSHLHATVPLYQYTGPQTNGNNFEVNDIRTKTNNFYEEILIHKCQDNESLQCASQSSENRYKLLLTPMTNSPQLLIVMYAGKKELQCR